MEVPPSRLPSIYNNEFLIMTNTHLEKVKSALQQIQSGLNVLSNGPMEYSISLLIEAHTYLMENHSPFRPGDRCVLVKPVDFDNASGWRGAKHWLKPGAQGEVSSVEFRSKQFVVNVLFDDESFVTTSPGKDYFGGPVIPAGTVRPIKEKHLYSFDSKSLVKL